MEAKKRHILEIQETVWCLKSRALWPREGDRNTRFFHLFLNHRRNINAIWHIKTNNRDWVHSTNDILREAISYFENFYKAWVGVNIVDQIWGSEDYPSMFNKESNQVIFHPITLEEILWVLKSFAKDKCPCPDGWTMDILIHFFDLMGEDLVDLVGEWWLSRQISRAINSTFLALILKKYDPSSFEDLRPISLCNIIYKLISKVIAEHIKNNLSKFIYRDQFGFLHNCLIYDVIGTTQECIHIIHTKNLEAVVMKVALHKAYDCVNWSFLHLILTKIGLVVKNVDWIMACVSLVWFVALINGYQWDFFGGKGIETDFLLFHPCYSFWSWTI